MPGGEIIEADLTWVDGRFQAGTRIEVGADGRIAAVGADLAAPSRRLRDRAILPGFVNVHSHAFQRGLRGRGETFRQGEGSFWSWREAMYELVEALDAERLHELSCRAFREMRAAGITTVGEFHYLHHDRTCDGYALDEVVLGAAASAGIRIALLQTYYATGGIDRPLEGGQRRFRVRSPDEFWAQVDRLAERIDTGTQSLGVAAHSIRAAGIDDVAALFEESERRGLAFHMHVEEQPREVEACLEHYARTPMALLLERLEVSPRFTAVHCTHTAAADMSRLLEAGGNVCVCPLTEANLGDGIPELSPVVRHHGRICLGTDSNARISMLEEMRWLEYGQRLRRRSRGVCVDDEGRVARSLLQAATAHGAIALGLRTGAIQAGRYADLVTIDLTRPELAGWTPETLLETLVFGAAETAIAATCVGGAWSKV